MPRSTTATYSHEDKSHIKEGGAKKDWWPKVRTALWRHGTSSNPTFAGLRDRTETTASGLSVTDTHLHH